MRTLASIETAIDNVDTGSGTAAAAALLTLAEDVLEHWIVARGDTPTLDAREGFRLLALHRQGAKGDPSFNACRETCREIVYHYNLVTMDSEATETTHRLEMMKLVTTHLYLFISGKMQVAELGEFCCSSKPIRQSADAAQPVMKEA